MARTSSRARARRPARLLCSLAAVCGLLSVVVACGSGGAAVEPSVLPSGSPATNAPDASPEAQASTDPESVCRRIDDVELGIARLRAVELKLTERVPLDIELGNLDVAFDDLDSVDLGDFRDQLQDPLRRLSYRLHDVELAVEDFRTNRRPRRAAPHVEDAARTFANEVAAFRVLARC